MKFLLGMLCGLVVGLALATAWSVSAQEALDYYLQQQQARTDLNRLLDLREAEFESRTRANAYTPSYDPCRK